MYNFALSSANYNAEQYYHFKKGYETLVNALLRKLRSYPNIRIHFNQKVKSVTTPEKGGRFEIETFDPKTFSADRLVFAIPKANLMEIEGLTDLYPLFQSVRPVSLNRVYAKFPSLDWMPRYNIHSDLPLKQVIVNQPAEKNNDGFLFDERKRLGLYQHRNPIPGILGVGQTLFRKTGPEIHSSPGLDQTELLETCDLFLESELQFKKSQSNHAPTLCFQKNSILSEAPIPKSRGGRKEQLKLRSSATLLFIKNRRKETETIPSYTLDEVALHATPKDGWIALFGKCVRRHPVDCHPPGGERYRTRSRERRNPNVFTDWTFNECVPSLAIFFYRKLTKG